MKRTPLKRKTPLRKVGRKADREREALIRFREALRVRSAGMCEAQTPACPIGPHPGLHAHHRAPSDRDKGRHDPARGLFCCAESHSFIHNSPALSYERGWLIRDGARMTWRHYLSRPRITHFDVALDERTFAPLCGVTGGWDDWFTVHEQNVSCTRCLIAMRDHEEAPR